MRCVKKYQALKTVNWNKIEFWGFGLLTVSLFLPKSITSWSIGLMGLIVGLKWIGTGIRFKGYSGLVLFPVLFGLLLAGQLYTDDLSRGFSVLERHLSFILIPIAAYSIRDFSTKQKKNLADLFILSVLLAGVYCVGVASFKYVQTGSVYAGEQTGHFVYNNFMHQKLSGAIGLHAIYFSLFVSFAGVLVLHWLLDGWQKLLSWQRAMYLLALAFFFLLIFLLKSAVFGMLFPFACLLVFTYQLGKNVRSSPWLRTIAALLLIALMPFVYFSTKTKLDDFGLQYQLSDEHLSPLTMRFAIWECSWQVIEHDWLLGTGTGDGYQSLLDMYQEKGFKIGLENRFNTHNMYLQYFMGNGIFAVLCYMAILLSVLLRGVRHNNILGIVMIMFFAVFSITESTLLTVKGMAFFVFFSSLFYWEPKLWMGTR